VHANNVAARRLLALLDHADVVDHLAGYFAERDDGRPLFTGSRFETLGGMGDGPQVADRLTAADLVAVTTLSVKVPAETAIWMLDAGAEQLSDRLSSIRVDIQPDTDEGRSLLTDRDGPLWQLWALLKAQDGIGWVTAGKLCSRKRPTLAPIYDEHVRTAVGNPSSWCEMIAAAYRDTALTGRLKQLHDQAGLPSHVSSLRVLDITIWMRQHGHKYL
jgi:hypothetical protein